jgi:hypothetical protein
LLATDLPAPGAALLRCRYGYRRATPVTAAYAQISAVKIATLIVQ